ncbi:MAG: MFS transporter [Clostridia bacterium]|nr:MFS transporter [Clostridia bacterium]
MKDKYMANERLSVLLFLSVALIYAFTYMTKNCYAAAMVLLVNEGVLTKTQTGTIGAAFYLVYATFQIFGGMAADKYSPYRLIATGLAGAAIANIIISLTYNYHIMIIVWSLNAAVQFGIWPSIFKIVSTKLSPVHRHNGIFYIMLSSSVGLVLSYIFAGFASSWRSNFEISAISLIACFIFWIIAGNFFDKRMVSDNITSHGVAHLPEYKLPEKNKKAGFSKLLIKSGLIILLPAVVIRTVFEQGIQTIIPTMINESYDNITPSVSSILNLIPIFFGISGKITMDFICKKRTYNQALAMGIVFSVLVPLLASMLLIGKINMWIILIIVSMVVLIAAAGSYIATFMALPFTPYGFNGTTAGIINAMASLGIVVGNYALTRIADDYSWTAVWLVLACMSVVGFVLCLIAFTPWKNFSESNE